MPLTVVDPVDPVTLMVSTRPPMSPSPLRVSTSIDTSEPTLKAASMVATGTLACQVWFGFDGVASPSSITGGNTPPAV